MFIHCDVLFLISGGKDRRNKSDHRGFRRAAAVWSKKCLLCSERIGLILCTHTMSSNKLLGLKWRYTRGKSCNCASNRHCTYSTDYLGFLPYVKYIILLPLWTNSARISVNRFTEANVSMWILQYVQHVLAEIGACLLEDTVFWITIQRKVETDEHLCLIKPLKLDMTS